MPRFHIPLIEPDVRISRIRLSDGRRLQAHATCSVQATSLEGQACSRIASSFFGGYRLAPLSRPLVLPKRVRSQAPFLRRHYPASQVLRACPPPHTARPVPHGLPVGVSHHRWGFPCCVGSPCIRAVAITPAGPLGVRVAFFPNDGGLPRNSGGSAPALPFSRPAQRSLTLRPAYSPSRLATLYTGGFGDVVAYVPAPVATDWSNPCRMGLAPAEDPRLFTAHGIHCG